MKKLLIVFVLVTVFSTGTVFAQREDPRPDNFGIGVLGRFGGGWLGGTYGGAALALKIPNLPVYWGIDFDLYGDSYFRVGVTADFLNIFGGKFIPCIGWYWDLGAFAGLGFGNDRMDIDIGVRLPLGLTFQPIEWFEIFLAWVPSIGVGIRTRLHNDDRAYLYGGWPFELGIRFWF